MAPDPAASGGWQSAVEEGDCVITPLNADSHPLPGRQMDVACAVADKVAATSSSTSNSYRAPGFLLPEVCLHDVTDQNRVHRYLEGAQDDDDDLPLAQGLRNPFVSMMLYHRPLTVGPFLRKVIEAYLTSRPAIRWHLSDVISKKLPIKIPESAMEEFRQVLAKSIGAELKPRCSPLTAIRHDLLSGLT
eukprot:906079-Amphidinium_carterae.1